MGEARTARCPFRLGMGGGGSIASIRLLLRILVLPDERSVGWSWLLREEAVGAADDVRWPIRGTLDANPKSRGPFFPWSVPP